MRYFQSSITRGARALVGCLIVWRVAGGAWRTAETSVVRVVLSMGGVHADQTGEQLLVHRGGASAFLASIGPWCSAFGPVLAFVAIGAVAPGPARRRTVAVVTASAVVLAGNIVRLAGVMAIGAIGDTADLEQWHDGAGVVLAVGVLLCAGGWLLNRLWPMPTGRRVPAGPLLGRP